MEDRVGNALAGLLRHRQALVDQRQRDVRAFCLGFQFSAQPEEIWNEEPVALGNEGLLRLADARSARFGIAEPTARPTCEHFAYGGMEVHTMLPGDAHRRLGGAERGVGVMPVADKNNFHQTRVNDGRAMARADRIPNRLLAEPPGSLDLAHKPHRPSKLRRRNDSVVPTDPESRFPIASGNKVPERALGMGSRLDEFALLGAGHSED